MASGRRHEIVNLSAFVGLAAAYPHLQAQGGVWAQLFNRQTLLLFSFSYFVGTFLVTPDLDLSEGRVRSKGNWGVLGWLWLPYGALFKHRGLSHTWLVGPLTRLAYLVVLGLALTGLLAQLAPLFGYELRVQARLLETWRPLALSALAGYYLSQWLHLVADGIWPDHDLRGWRGVRRPRRRRR